MRRLLAAALAHVSGSGATAGFAALLAVVSIDRAPAAARSLTDVFRSGTLAGLELEPVGRALANSVASTYPVASASSSVTYTFNPATDTFDRQTGVLGPIIGERAETIGERRVDVALGYSYVRLTSIDGQDLGSLVNEPIIDGRFVFERVPEGVELRDGRRTNVLPVRVLADLDVEAQIVTPSVTYGVTADLDVNVSLPLLRTFLRASVMTERPDPRLPQFSLPEGSPAAMQRDESSSASSVGVGDLLLRAKYILLRDRPVSVAAALGLSLPTGDADDLQGTGTTRVQPTLVLSRVLWGRFEPLLNLGMDIDADDVDRSVFRWAVGGTGHVAGPLHGQVIFLGRNELAPLTDQIETPFFFQIERNDIYDVALGLRWLFAGSGVASVNFLMPLNDEGLRADFIPTVALEYTF
ncbi:MAG: transporter [Thermodesulfobacteriota bacterium]